MPTNPGLFIPLTRGYRAVVSPEDYARMTAERWHTALRNCSIAYAARNVRRGSGTYTLMLMHREILSAAPGMDVDHINGPFFGDPSRKILDNRRCNLRLATRSENARNRRQQRNSTSGHIGVHWHKQRRRWQAKIKINGRKLHLGYFDSLQEASDNRDFAATLLHGRFASLNTKHSADSLPEWPSFAVTHERIQQWAAEVR